MGKTNKQIELNTEAINALSIADLSTTITMIKLYPRSVKRASEVLPLLMVEMDKKMNNLFIF